MQERHKNRKQYFDEQAYTTKRYVIPFIEKHLSISSKTKVLEIGCGEGGNLLPFLELGCTSVGIDLNEVQIENAKGFLYEYCSNNQLTLINENIYNIENDNFSFDVIMLRDVIEHIPNQERFMNFVKSFIAPKGVIFFGFPPWQNPFGGHQQICRSFISKTPYIHLLPKVIYKFILKLGREKKGTIKELLELKETGISIERFERIIKTEKYTTLQRKLFFINPNYEVKFGLKPKTLGRFFSSIRFIRNFYTTAGYYSLTI